MKKKKGIIAAGILLVLLLAGWAVWNVWGSTTRIAFVNYQVINLGQIAKANDNSFISINELPVDRLDEVFGYDMVFVNGMGLRITAEQRASLIAASERNIPILTTMATNPANNICSVDSTSMDMLKRYLDGGGRRNYRNMLNYVRSVIDGKIISTPGYDKPVPAANDMIYHASPAGDGEDEMGFNSVAEYNRFLAENGLLKDEAPRIVITGQMGEPTELIRRLEETGNVVYPVRSFRKMIKYNHIDTIKPSAIINMAHGRLGDYAVEYLEKNNIPLFSPVNVNRLTEEWEKDKMGMNGGFMSQSIVTPEIDGAILPYALFGHYADKDGLQHAYAIPERLETFVETVNNYIALSHKPNGDKKIAVFYYKGPGQNALTAAGMEVVPSLYNFLTSLRNEGYNVDGLPSSAEELGKIIQKRGAIFGSYADGAIADFMENGSPEMIDKDSYESWVGKSLRETKYSEVVELYGDFPGSFMSTQDGRLALARIRFGNVVILPQPAVGSGNNDFKMVHGTNQAPTHNYIAAYLWARYGFGADAVMHFGTHGSFEFTPGKQVALCSDDWSDRLIGSTPHFYLYTIGNVGEAMMAKRRSYATLHSYLTAPFMESNVRGIYRELTEAVKDYNNCLAESSEGIGNGNKLDKSSLKVKQLAVKLGIHRDLGLDSILSVPYSEYEISRIESFAEELANEKIAGRLYTLGVPYEKPMLESTVYAMATDPIAFSLYALDRLRGKDNGMVEKHKTIFTSKYVEPARRIVGQLLNNPDISNDDFICRIAGISQKELAHVREVAKSTEKPKDMMSMMMAMAEEKQMSGSNDAKNVSGKSGMPSHAKMAEMGKNMDTEKALKMEKAMGAPEEALKKMEAAMRSKEKNGNAKDMSSMMAMAGKMASGGKKYSKEEIEMANAVSELERTLSNVGNYRKMLLESPQMEIQSMINGLNGGYTSPSPGGDPVANPNTLPTGRNLYAINAEATPSEAAWEKGKRLADNTIEMYRKRHNDSIPRKVSYTLWSSEFIETEGATIAQILYMLGVEPVRDTFGRVTDLKLIPSEQLGRPRIDVVVQTSGQLRDIAASRLFLINRAVEMAAASKADKYENLVSVGVVETERVLIERGITPKDAREISSYRVFGGINGNYGTGIQEMVQAGDRWESEKDIADVYLNNMGAYYGSEKNWEAFRQFAFEAALTRTDAVVQPRQSNTWGALSLDHVYEFMGGMNLAVRNVTGKDPDAYLSDYRNRNNVRMQEVKEAIGVESRTTIFNPAYIKEKMKGGASEAGAFAEIIDNTYGWNVMKPKAIDKEMWDEIYNIYVKDKFNMGVKDFFETQNPAALQQITATMMETARKGLWKASKQQLQDIADLHTELVSKYAPSCSGTVCNNASLRKFIASNTADKEKAVQYQKSIDNIRQSAAAGKDKGMVMKKEQINPENEETVGFVSNIAVGITVAVIVVVMIVLVRKRRKNIKG